MLLGIFSIFLIGSFVMLLNMPIVIVAAFLFLTLVVGIYFSKKETTFREYAVGSKNFSTATLVYTVLATTFGGGTIIRSIESIHELGLYIIFGTSLDYFGFWIIGRLALRMGPFMKHLSMAETIGSIYGKYPRIIAALVGICVCVVVITVQIKVMSNAFKICLNSIDPFTMTIFSTLLLIFYSSYGGVRAVTYTDVLQFITFSIIIPLLCWFIFIKVGKPVSEIVPMLQSHTKFQFSNLFQFNTRLVSMLLLILGSLISHIQPSIMQRVYMSSSPVQAQKSFAYATIFSWFIMFFISLTSVFVFAGAPNLLKTEVFGYVVDHIPTFFRGFFAVGLLAMAMSTADSFLNACSVMISHDIVNSLQKQKAIPDLVQLKIPRWTTLVLGLLAMVVSFYCEDLLKLMYLGLGCAVPIVTAPFILGIFGFRGTSRTALIGMTTGLLTILAWDKWIEPKTAIDGSFIAMLANGFAMLVAHYLLRQPEAAGWVKPDTTFKQIQQENTRRSIERKEAIKNAWQNKKIILSKLVPSSTTMVCMGFYFFISSLLTHFILIFTNHYYWLIFHLFGSACCLGYPFLYDISKKIRAIPNWLIGLVWLIVLGFYLPFNVLWNWFNPVNPIFILSLSLAHLSIILSVLPIYMGIGVITVTSLLVIYPIYIGLSYPVLCSLYPLFLMGLLIFTLIIFFKIKVYSLTTQNIYLKGKEKNRESKQLKASLYEAVLVPSHNSTSPKKYGSILAQVVGKVEESISFLDNHTPIYKEDLQSIMNKFYDWVDYFNKRGKAKDHALLEPTKITLDKLVRKVEIALSQEMDDPPKILVEKIRPSNGELYSDIVCDINQVVYSLVKAVLRIGRIKGPNPSIVRIELHPTSLQFKAVDSIDHSCPVFIDFQAIALIVSRSSGTDASLPKVKSCYHEVDFIDPRIEKGTPSSIDLELDTISSMVRAHYGYLEASFGQNQSVILMVLPLDVTDIINKMTIDLPLDSLTSEGFITPKEEADSMMELMKSHDHICKSSCEANPIDIKTISGILFLLKKHFRFKRHASGKLFYVRAVGITKLVVDWVFHSPKVVYAALLYGLIRRTCLPLSYVKEHYNLGVYAFVSNIIKIDKREELNHPSLLYVQNRLEQAIKEEHVQLSVLFIKLAERLYDLRHAAGYIHLSEVKHMVQETLDIDVQIANRYLGSEIAQALEEASKRALEVCNLKGKEKVSVASIKK
ncbi:sodium:solute symporter family transporter [Cardinium endosymbiont of Bemisia tabaci]|uniref:sodium:solute symporter family transporter n=1 Tax=Cardinium endosymbiont of Bemisia tabaci TaxID=672794 RepID=UPI001CB7E280|nr:HD domain-containing protein [Cardinium endosymbiont of Bemisia tabaci]